jgi:hypothetical protein
MPPVHLLLEVRNLWGYPPRKIVRTSVLPTNLHYRGELRRIPAIYFHYFPASLISTPSSPCHLQPADLCLLLLPLTMLPFQTDGDIRTKNMLFDLQNQLLAAQNYVDYLIASGVTDYLAGHVTDLFEGVLHRHSAYFDYYPEKIPHLRSYFLHHTVQHFNQHSTSAPFCPPMVHQGPSPFFPPTTHQGPANAVMPHHNRPMQGQFPAQQQQWEQHLSVTEPYPFQMSRPHHGGVAEGYLPNRNNPSFPSSESQASINGGLLTFNPSVFTAHPPPRFGPVAPPQYRQGCPPTGLHPGIYPPPA